DDLFEGNDLEEFAAIVEVMAVRRAHAVGEAAANAQIDPTEGGGEALWAPPPRHVCGVSPGLPDERARRIENARDDLNFIGGVAGGRRSGVWRGSFGHGLSPRFSFRVRLRRACLGSPPRGGGSRSPSRRRP